MTSLTTDAAPLVVQVRENWSDAWTNAPDLQPIRGSIAAENNNQQGSFTFLYRYGATMYPTESVFSDRNPVDFDHWWVRVLHSPYGATDILWQGRFMADPTQVFGNQSGNAANAAGIQTLIAYDGHTVLQKIEWFGSSIRTFDELTSANSFSDTEYVMSFNRRTQSDMAVSDMEGNMTPDAEAYSATGVTYRNSFHLFGAKSGQEMELWTAMDAATYLIERSNWDDADVPIFHLTGQTSILEDIIDVWELPTPYNVLDALRTVINRKYGVGFVVLPDNSGTEGFQIKVFSLLADPVTFGSSTLPANATKHTIAINSSIEHTQISVERSNADAVGSIRVVGQRAVIVASFERSAGMLEPMWSPAIESTYADPIAGPGPFTPEQLDRARQNDKFRHVYSSFRVPLSQAHGAIPTFYAEADGTLNFDSPQPKVNAIVRETLDWTPLQEGLDYSADPPTDFGSEYLYQQPFLPPALYVSNDDGYLLAETVGIACEVMRNELGVSLRSQVPHYHAAGVELTTNIPPEYSTAGLVATIAYEADNRPGFTYELADHKPTNGRKVIVVDAQLWLLAPDTVIGVDEDGALVRSPSSWVVLRDNTDQLEQAMAGAIGRYTVARQRLTATAMGISLWQYRLGDIVHIINDGTPASAVKGPMTSINWEFDGGHRSVIKTGYARLNPGELSAVVFQQVGQENATAQKSK